MKDLLEEARQIYFETMRQIDVQSLIEQKVHIEDGILTVGGAALDLDSYREIVVIGIGKASLKMGFAIESLLGDRFTRGILVTDRRDRTPAKSRVLVGGHPLPDSNSLEAGRQVIDLVRSCGTESLIVFLISGGGSALVEAPISSEVSLEDLQQLNLILTQCGANISEINTIRKHFSGLKGGRLGFHARHSARVALYLSDVNPGDLRSIASNPLLLDDVTLEKFFEVLERYDLRERLPSTLRGLIERELVSPLPVEGLSDAMQLNLLLLENSDAVARLAENARSRGFRVEVETGCVEGYYRDVADSLIRRLLELHLQFPREPICLVSGGEVSCPVIGSGVGGRSQEFVLYSAARLAELGGVFSGAVLSCGTDGIDGNSNAAGAVACTGLASAAQAHGLEVSPFIQGNDSHSFLKQAGGLIFTGPAGNNVRDLRIMLARPVAA